MSAVSWDLSKVNPRFRLVWQQAETNFPKNTRIYPVCQKYDPPFIMTGDSDMWDTVRKLHPDTFGYPKEIVDRPYTITSVFASGKRTSWYVTKGVKPQLMEMYAKEVEQESDAGKKTNQ